MFILPACIIAYFPHVIANYPFKFLTMFEEPYKCNDQDERAKSEKELEKLELKAKKEKLKAKKEKLEFEKLELVRLELKLENKRLDTIYKVLKPLSVLRKNNIECELVIQNNNISIQIKDTNRENIKRSFSLLRREQIDCSLVESKNKIHIEIYGTD